MKKESMLKNGSLLLKERISYFNGKYFNPIRSFCMKELQNATDDYNTGLIFDHDVGNCIWYKGSLEGRTISVRTNFYEGVEMAINEIVIASQMSAHKNALKLLGCCLETRIPILVYEFPSGGSLIDRIFSPPNPLSWKSRLRIAYDIANVIAYLHTAFPRSIIHTDIKPSSFFLDQDCAAKLSDFSLSITLPEGEMHVEDEIRGTFGYLAPETLISGVYTEKNDVFSFGILLLELLIGKRVHSIMHEERASIQDYAQSFVNTYDINGTVDPIILAQPRGIHEELQFQAIFDLAMRCSMKDMDERPTIVNAAKEVRRIQKFVP